VGDLLVGWSSKKQPTIPLTCCESKYLYHGEAYQEAVFMCQLVEELFAKLTRPTVDGNNQWALFLVNGVYKVDEQ